MEHVPRFIDLREVEKMTSLKKTKIYQIIKKGEFKPIKIDKKTVFLESEIIEWILEKVKQRNTFK